MKLSLNNQLYIIYYFFYILIYLNALYVKCNDIYIKNEKELIENINSNDVLIIDDIFDVNNTIETSSNELFITIKGKSPGTSSINFLNDAKFIFNNNGVQIIDVTLNGNIIFNNTTDIQINGIIFNGCLMVTLNGGNIYIKDSIMIPKSKDIMDNGFIFKNGEIYINKTKFYGNSNIKNLIYFNGNKKYMISINDSVLDGNYLSSHINISNSTVNINNSKLINGYSETDGLLFY